MDSALLTPGAVHQLYADAKPEAQCLGSHEHLWHLLNGQLPPEDSTSDRWSWRILPTGTVVALRRGEGGVRELLIKEPPLPGDGSKRNQLHARWANELDALRTAFGVRGWHRVATDEQAVLYADLKRVEVAETVPVVFAVPGAPVQGDLLAGVAP